MVKALPVETAQTTLVHFLREVLRMGVGEDRAILPPSVTRHVRLEHLCDLWELALSLTETDWTSGVSQRFREELPVGLAREVVTAGDGMGPDLEVLLPLFKV